MPSRKQQPKYEPKFRFSFNPRSAVSMAAPYRSNSRISNMQGASSSSGLKGQHDGKISKNAARKIRSAIEWLLASAEAKWLYSKKTNKFHQWKLSFLTLTLPTQGHMSDIEVKSILNSFLTLAKYNYGLRSYVWKAEPQKRGCIHFHLTSDCYMWKKSVQYEWNRLLSKSGLLNGHTAPPSTKIHSTYRVSNMAAYLTKYFVKPPVPFVNPPFKQKYPGLTISFRGSEEIGYKFPENLFYVRPLSGRLWGCSHSLSAARALSYTVDVPEMRAMNADIRAAGAKEKQKTYCNFYQLPADYYDNLSHGQLKHDYNAHLLNIRKKKNSAQLEIYSPEGDLITDKKILVKFETQTRLSL